MIWKRTRLKDVRALFFVGVNEGNIPKNTQTGGILTEMDREFFKDQGMEACTGTERAYEHAAVLSVSEPDKAKGTAVSFLQSLEWKRRSQQSGFSDPYDQKTVSEA